MESFKKGNDVSMEDLVKLEKRATEYEEEDLNYIKKKLEGKKL